jgi:hypothetical protein
MMQALAAVMVIHAGGLLADRFVLPGLIDLHKHISMPLDAESSSTVPSLIEGNSRQSDRQLLRLGGDEAQRFGRQLRAVEFDFRFDVFEAEPPCTHGARHDIAGLKELQQADQSAWIGFDDSLEHERVPRVRTDSNSQRRPASADAGRRI